MHQKSLEEDSVTVSLEKASFGQDDMANLIVNNLDAIYVSDGEKFVPVTKEDIYFIDINKCKLNIKLNSNDENTEAVKPNDKNTETYHYNYKQADILLSNTIKNNSKQNILKECDFSDKHIYISNSVSCSGSGSGLGLGYLSYGLDLI